MAIIKCKMCGGDIELSADKSFGVCEFCGSTMTLPKVDDEQRAAAFNRGNHFRRIGEFDKALTVYESLVRDNEADAEAHWCCALCRFGIEYVKDPASGEYIPTCHRASFDSFLEDVDAKAAIEHADAVAKRQYEHDAKVIEEVRRGILTLSQNERPYDVFICYKETDDRGQRTIDSQRAQEIYYQLTDQGRRVFFARITLEDKAGQQYEPYIFAALNSAKVMIVVGTRREHLEAVWVKNEWSRFLAIMKRDRKKLLIPCYADMDPYDMPEQLSVLQSYDMTKIGFIQDLTRGISKVLDADKKPALAAVTAAPEQVPMSSNVKALLKRGYMALEDGDWDKADEFFEQVLNQDAECAEAYMGKALAEHKYTSLDTLFSMRKRQYENEKAEEIQITTDEKRVQNAFERWELPNYLTQDVIRQYYEFRESYTSTVKYWTEAKTEEEDWWKSDRNLVRARKYASGTYKETLEDGYKKLMAFFDGKNREAMDRRDADKAAMEQRFSQALDDADKKVAGLYDEVFLQREADYASACDAQAEGVREKNPNTLYSVAKQFKIIGNYKDTIERSDSCTKTANEICEKRRQEEREVEREAAERHAQELQRKAKKKAIITWSIVAAIALIVVSTVIFATIIRPSMRYSDAEELLAAGDYDEAIGIFTELGDYKDAADRIQPAKYEKAEALITEGEFDAAVNIFTELGDYNDSADRIVPTYYEKAEALMLEGKTQEAAIAFGKTKDFKDATALSRELWEEANRVVSLECGSYHTVALKADGTIATVGNNNFGQCDVSSWTDIVAISAGERHTIGLKPDGTVVAVGENRFGQCDVSDWSDVIAISAGQNHTVGLKSDGTVVAAGSNDYGACNVSNWSDIIAISAGSNHTVGLKSDGTVVAAGTDKEGQCRVSGWTDIVAISAGGYHTVGIKSDGTVVAVGYNNNGMCNVSDWTEIVSVSAGTNHTIGLKSDGTVVAVGYNKYRQCDVSDWTDIVAISACDEITVGLKSDGTVVMAGKNGYRQFDATDWTDIWVPNLSKK